eukprot:364801-Chlamydomonas_euryale.AAC.1
MTLEELARHDGSLPAEFPLRLAIQGIVYDITKVWGVATGVDHALQSSRCDCPSRATCTTSQEVLSVTACAAH